MDKILLQMRDVTKKFPGVYALKAVNFDLKTGEVHALLGENGAGKSTLMKILGGIYSTDEGTITLNEKEEVISSVKDAQRLGINIIHQEIVLVPYLSISENIFLGREPKTAFGFVDKHKIFEESQKLLDDFDMRLSAETEVRELTVAQQQMVEIIKAVSFNSRIIVMDEPTSSLSEKEVQFLFKTIKNLTTKGVGIVYISHRMDELLKITNRITVMRDGEYIGTVNTKDTSIEQLISMMVGRELSSFYERNFHEVGEIVLDVQNLNSNHFIQNVNFHLKKGEILGFSGLVGSGRSELMKSIFGLEPINSGTVKVNGKEGKIKSPNDAIKHKIAYVTENRKEEGLFLIESVRFNTTIKIIDKFMKYFRVDSKYEKAETDRYIRELSIKTPSQEQEIRNLSGGNQQKVLISRWLATNPNILILDEPTRGVDIGAKAEIYSIINRLASEGVAIIMISSELPEVINMSDRIAVMNNGTIAKILDKNEFSQERIMHYATGGTD